jgi:hypothetical protein
LYQLSENEEIKYELATETGSYIVTNTRFIVKKTQSSGRSQSHEEFILDHIAHAYLLSKKGEDYRLIGGILTVLGIVIIVASYYYTSVEYGGYIIGFLFLLGGILLIFSKTDPVCILTLDVSGLSTSYKFTIDTIGKKVLELLSSINESRISEDTDLLKISTDEKHNFS